MVLVSAVSARNIIMTEQEANGRHLSIQERTCVGEHSAVLVSGSGALVTSGYGVDFTAHVCAAEDGRDHRATGKVLNTMQVAEKGHALYHAHCAYVDKDHGYAYLGLEIEDMKGPSATHMYGEDGGRLSKELTLAVKDGTGEGGRQLEARKLAKSKKSGKTTKAPGKGAKSGGKCPSTTDISGYVTTFTFKENCPCDCSQDDSPDCTVSISACCCDHCTERRLVGTMWDAAEEVTSGNEPKGTLAIFRFEKGIGTDESSTAAYASASSADRFAMVHHATFDTTCEGFADAVKTVQFTDKEVSDLIEGKFHIP
jgi:hypothetical protein